MKLRVGVKCSGWERPEFLELELPDSASKNKVEEAMREAAIEAANFEFWLEAQSDVRGEPSANNQLQAAPRSSVGLNEFLGRWPGDLQMTIFGYTWDEIKRAQQGGALARRIPDGIYKPLATEGDWELLDRYGEAELRSRGYYGVLDRLENTRLANDMPDCDRSACRDHSLGACDNPNCPSLRPNEKVKPHG